MVRKRRGQMEGGDFSRLPEGCIAHVLSLTTPRDVCRSSAVSAIFRSAASSDTVWERLLPPDYEKILSRAVDPVGPFASKRELYFRLCEPLLLDGGRMSFSVEKGSGKKCYMLSARELLIVWGKVPEHWRWTFFADSRFSEVAELLKASLLGIQGIMETKVLSPKTSYAAYLVFKILNGSRGLYSPAQETLLRMGSHVDKHTVCLQPEDTTAQERMFWYFMLEPEHIPRVARPPHARVARPPHARSDGWMEMELGEFFNDCEDDGEVEMSLMEARGRLWKRGLIIEGIEVRPKK